MEIPGATYTHTHSYSGTHEESHEKCVCDILLSISQAVIVLFPCCMYQNDPLSLLYLVKYGFLSHDAHMTQHGAL